MFNTTASNMLDVVNSYPIEVLEEALKEAKNHNYISYLRLPEESEE